MSGMAAKKLRIIQAAGTSDQSAAVAAQRVEETLQEWQLSKLWLRIQKAADLKRCRKNVQKTAAEHMSRMAAKKLRIVEKAAVYQSADSSRWLHSGWRKHCRNGSYLNYGCEFKRLRISNSAGKMFKRPLQNTCPECLQKSCVLLKRLQFIKQQKWLNTNNV
jgi:hypothetical protein